MCTMVKRKKPRFSELPKLVENSKPHKDENVEQYRKDLQDKYIDRDEEKHPLTDKLQKLDFRILPIHFFITFYGARRTGKTHFTTSALHSIRNRFDYVYVFSCTAHLHVNEPGEVGFDMVTPDGMIDGFDEEKLEQIIERQKEVKKHNNTCKCNKDKIPNETLLIFDDFVHENRVRYSKTFTELPVLGRHYDLSVICLSQGYSSVGSSGLNPATRQNSDLVITFLPRNSDDSEKMAKWYMSKSKKDNIWLLESVCEQEFTCFAMDLQHPHLRDAEDYCYIGLAEKKIPKYEMGKIQWKLWKEEKKIRRRQVLAGKIEQELDSYKSASDRSLRNRSISYVASAIGRPSQGSRAPMSLFDFIHG